MRLRGADTEERRLALERESGRGSTNYALVLCIVRVGSWRFRLRIKKRLHKFVSRERARANFSGEL